MDLRLYYKKIREVEASFETEFPVVVSHETADGGKPGTTTEAPRRIAARLLVDGIAHLATPEETEEYYQARAEAKRIADHLAAAANVRFTLLSPAELDSLTAPARTKE